MSTGEWRRQKLVPTHSPFPAVPVFSNPLGLLALLGVPVLLAIHFLQRRAVEVPASTLFLWRHALRDPSVGRRFDRLLPSVPLWMQLLAVLLVAWLLSEPRFPQAGSVARVAVVVDSSASMSVFRDEAVAALEKALPELQGRAAGLEITLLDADPRRPGLFTGTSVAELAAHLRRDWHPRGGAVDPARALRVARSLVSNEGVVVWLSDTPREDLPHDAVMIAVGGPVENVGFTGVEVTRVADGHQWMAMVRNYADTPQTREWSLHAGDAKSAARALELPPRGVVTLEGAFPAGEGPVRLVLSGDRFVLDDVLPMVVPRGKRLTLRAAGPPLIDDLARRLVAALDDVEPAAAGDSPDVLVAAVAAGELPENSRAAVLFARDDSADGEWHAGALPADGHPLAGGLNWQPLATRTGPAFPPRDGDTVLLWRDGRPLVFLRGEAGAERLMCNFDPRHGNALTQPAFVVLLQRFVDRTRAAVIAPETAQLETGQRISVTRAPALPLEIRASDPAGRPLEHDDASRAPADPGFLTISQDGVVLLHAAAHFADTGEADFSACATGDTLAGAARAASMRHSTVDPAWRLWLLLVVAAVVVAWKFTPNQDARR